MTSQFHPTAFGVYAPGRINLGATKKRICFKGAPLISYSQFGGKYAVIGSTAVAATPDVMVERMVLLYSKRTKRPVRAQISSPSGEYKFMSMASGPWFVVAFDHTGEYNAVIADNIVGTPI